MPCAHFIEGQRLPVSEMASPVGKIFDRRASIREFTRDLQSTPESLLGKGKKQYLEYVVRNNPIQTLYFTQSWENKDDITSYPIAQTAETLVYPRIEPRGVMPLSAKDFLEEGLAPIEARLSPNEDFSLAAVVQTHTGDNKFIPLADMRVDKNETNLQRLNTHCMALIEMLHYEGAFLIFETRHSYHIMGTALMDEKDFLAFLGLNNAVQVQKGEVVPYGNSETTTLGDPLNTPYSLVRNLYNGVRIADRANSAFVSTAVSVVTNRKN